MPGLQQHLFRLLSRDIGNAALLAGDWSADERMAAFLSACRGGCAARGFSADAFQLAMARTDIANYLRLAPETVSRVLRRFQDDGLLRWTGANWSWSDATSSRHWPRRCCASDPAAGRTGLRLQRGCRPLDLGQGVAARGHRRCPRPDWRLP